MYIYDRKLIGKCISWGSDHTVYEYGPDKVIKFSVSDFLLGKSKTISDYTTCREFFGEYILGTEHVQSVHGEHKAGIQPKITGEYLLASHFSDQSIRNQFKEIMDAYDCMKAAQKGEIDLVGSGGILVRCLSNIFVSPEKKLIIIDSSILDLQGHYFNPLRYIFLFIICPIAIARQRSTIKKFKSLL